MADWNIFQPTDASKPIHQILSGIQRGGFYVTNDNDEDKSRQALLDALAAAGYPAPSPSDPVYVHRTDTGNLERNTGNGWNVYPDPVEDTGWVTLSYASGYSSASTGQLRARMIEGQVHLLGGASGTFPRNSYTRINSSPLPVEMRPSADIFVAAVGSAGRSATARITTSGYIEPNHYWEAAPGWMSVAGITYTVI